VRHLHCGVALPRAGPGCTGRGASESGRPFPSRPRRSLVRRRQRELHGSCHTHAVGPVHRGIIDWSIQANPELASSRLLPVVAETWDGYLNDVNGPHVTTEITGQALDAAASGEISEGSVGGGTGMCCYGFKGGTGTASRRVPVGGRTYNVGVLMQANFGRRAELVIAGRPAGRALADDNPMEDTSWTRVPPGSGSCIVVVATDAPLLPGQCKALARRVPLGLARTGTTGSHYSGDLFLAFSTASPGALDSALSQPQAGQLNTIELIPWGQVNPLYEAVVQAVEEATLNALVAGRDMTGRDGHRVPGFPVRRLGELLRG
jgi:D-aminopeptidase